MAQLRVLLGFADASDHQLEECGAEVLGGIYENTAIYPTPPVLKPALTAGLESFRAAMAAQESSGTQGTAAKDQARGALIALLRPLALYVQQVIQANDAFGLAELLLSGFEAVSTNRAQQPLATPNILAIVNSGEGAATASIKAVPNTRMYEGQKRKQGTTEWLSAGLFSSSRGLLFTGLEPGAMYEFRVRALGGSTGHSEWSNAVSRRSL